MSDVAEKAGVSTMTVSRVLRHSKQVRTEVRQRVLATAEALGYEVDEGLGKAMSLSKLRRSRGTAGTIAMLRCIDRMGASDTKLPSVAIEPVRSQALKDGFGLDYLEVENDTSSVQQVERVLEARGTAGLIVVPKVLDHAIQKMAFENFPVVTVGYALPWPGLTRVATDLIHGTFEVMELLCARNCQRVGLAVTRFCDERVNHGFTGGYLAALSRQGMEPPCPILWLDSIDPDLRAAAIADWVRANQLDAVLSTETVAPMRSVQYVNLDAEEANCGGGVLGISHNRDEVAVQAVNQLVSQMIAGIKGIPAIPVCIQVPSKLIGAARL